MTGRFRDGGGGGCWKDVGRDVPVFSSGFADQLARNWSWERFDVGVDQHERSWYRFNVGRTRDVVYFGWNLSSA